MKKAMWAAVLVLMLLAGCGNGVRQPDYRSFQVGFHTLQLGESQKRLLEKFPEAVLRNQSLLILEEDDKVMADIRISPQEQIGAAILRGPRTAYVGIRLGEPAEKLLEVTGMELEALRVGKSDLEEGQLVIWVDPDGRVLTMEEREALREKAKEDYKSVDLEDYLEARFVVREGRIQWIQIQSVYASSFLYFRF